jgi:hypothetical protein
MLTDFLLNEILPFVLVKYITKDYYPVIVGGTVLNKCTNINNEVTDIDIKFVATRDTSNKFEIINARNTCVDDILKMYHEKKSPTDPVLKKTSVIAKYSYRLAVYPEGEEKNVIIDTAVFGPEKNFMIQYKYIDYNKWLKSKSQDLFVPFTLDNNVPWADCSWVYIDTVRMLMIWYDDYKIVTSSQQKTYIMKKILKYINKLLLMEVHWKHDGRFKPLLKKAKYALHKDDDKISITHLMSVINKQTSYKKIVKVLKDAEEVKNDIEYFRETINVLKASSPDFKKVFKVWASENERFVAGKYTYKFVNNQIVINDLFRISL